MSRRTEAAFGIALALLLAGGAGCVRREPAPQTAQVGRHRVRFELPTGWEHLDHGREQLFRDGETQVSLADHGPVTREAMARELREAERLWREGRRADAIQRVRALPGLRGPALRYLSPRQRAEFWRPWTDATYAPGADSSAIGAAFEALIAGTATLAEVTPERLLEHVLTLAPDTRGREIARREIRNIHGAEWTDLETWDRTSHLYRSRLAYLEVDGDLLVLAIDRGPYERSGPGFEALLRSLELVPE